MEAINIHQESCVRVFLRGEGAWARCKSTRIHKKRTQVHKREDNRTTVTQKRRTPVIHTSKSNARANRTPTRHPDSSRRRRNHFSRRISLVLLALAKPPTPPLPLLRHIHVCSVLLWFLDGFFALSLCGPEAKSPVFLGGEKATFGQLGLRPCVFVRF